MFIRGSIICRYTREKELGTWITCVKETVDVDYIRERDGESGVRDRMLITCDV